MTLLGAPAIDGAWQDARSWRTGVGVLGGRRCWPPGTAGPDTPSRPPVHGHCRVCAGAFRRCDAACRELIGALG